MTEAFKVLRYELIADDGSDRRVIQFALPGREFETAEVLEAFAPRDLRVIIWQININERDLVDGRRPHFPEVQRCWSFFDEKVPIVGNA
jgi:hypothetical protein